MSEAKGRFNWYELMTSDVEAAKAFYAALVGWTPRAFEGGGDYTLLHVGEESVGGIMASPQGAPTGWIGYISIGDVDGAADSIAKAGGAVHKAPADIPGVGRFAVVADPQGAVFSLITPFSDAPFQRAPRGTPGHIGWRELHTTDWEAALAFYSSQFGWTKDEPFDMGPMGVYQLFNDGAEPIGGMMTDKDFPQPAWLYYFTVPDIEAAVETIKSNGGNVVHGPHEVPGGDRIVVASDPQGAMFALTARPKG